MPDWLQAVHDMTADWKPCTNTAWHLRKEPWYYEKQFEWKCLTLDSIVVEVGGYRGLWASEIAKRYNPHIYLFEPSQYSIDAANERLADFPKIRMWEYALADRDGVFPLGDYQRDGASFMKDVDVKLAYMVDGAKFLNGLVDHIDLMQVNCEGSEYILLPHLINAGWMSKIKWVQIQWHVGGYGLESETYKPIIQCKLAETHEMLWNTIPFEVWALSSPKDEECKA